MFDEETLLTPDEPLPRITEERRMLTSKHCPPEFRPGIEIAEPDIYGRTKDATSFRSG
jgi:hypothetical protein